MTSTWHLVRALALGAGFLGCGSEVSSSSGDSGSMLDGRGTDAPAAEGSSMEGSTDGPQVVDGDTEPDSCVAIEVEAGAFDSGGTDAGMAGCDPDPCGPAQLCVAWVDMPSTLSSRTPFGECVDLPADIPHCGLTTCTPTPTCQCAKGWAGRNACGEKSCVQDGGAVVLTCYFPTLP
jgi:hypothetical protein